MKLIEVTIKNFRNILDSSPVRIQDDITCLVGKNESGKTSFLHALYRLNPTRPNVQFKVEEQYPAWLEKKDRMKGVNIDEFRPVSAKFEIEKDLINEIEVLYGENIFKNNFLTLFRSYEGTLYYTLNLDEKEAIKSLLKDLNFSIDIKNEITKAETIENLKEVVNNTDTIEEENGNDKNSLDALSVKIKNLYTDHNLNNLVWEIIKPKIPKFIYFDKYSSLPYTVKIKELFQADQKNLGDDDLTALALLKMAGAEDEYLLNPDYERRKRELENVANALTQDVLTYWSQNRELRVLIDLTNKNENRQNGQISVVDELKIRIWDNKHYLSLPFNEHSTGFQSEIMDLPIELNYFSMKASIITNQPTFTTNALSIYSGKFEYDDNHHVKQEFKDKIYAELYEFPVEQFSNLVEILFKEEKIQRAVLLFLYGHVASLEMRLPNYFVALEAITGFIVSNKKETKNRLNPIKSPDLANEIQKKFIEILNTIKNDKKLEKDDFDLDVLSKKINSLNNPPNADKLAESFSLLKFELSQEQRKILKERDSFLHGSFVKYVDNDEAFKEALYICLRVHFLIVVLVLKIVNFNGKIINYCVFWENITEKKVEEERLIKI